MPRYYATPNTLEIPRPWGNDYGWIREARFSIDSNNLLLIKIEKGGLNEAVPSPIKVFESDGRRLLDKTEVYFPSATDFAISRALGFYDFNGDEYPDLFIGNHGPEPYLQPFPGEPNAYYLYQPSKERYEEVLIPIFDFTHSFAVGNFSGDEYPDIFVKNLGGGENPGDYLLQNVAGQSFITKILPNDLRFNGAPFVAAIDLNQVNGDGILTIGNRVDLWSIYDLETPKLITSFQVEIPESGIFEVRVADFDQNGFEDLLIVGTGDELKSTEGVTIGGKIQAHLYFNVGTESQTHLDVFATTTDQPVVTGGINLDVLNLDNIHGLDFELRTFNTDWQPVRFTGFVLSETSVDLVKNLGGIAAGKGAYYDFDHDRVMDFIFERGDELIVALGGVNERYQGRAYDMDGNAGTAAKILGALWGKESVENPAFVGIVLHYLDSGVSYEALLDLALGAILRENKTNEAIVELVFTNLVGEAPTQDVKTELASYMDSGAYSQAGFARAIADLELNATNINLVGLSDTGLQYTEYVP